MTEPDRTFVDCLRLFESKERAMVIRFATGHDEVLLSAQFRGHVQKAFGIQLPDHVFVATDYHLDWLYGALVLAKAGDIDTLHRRVRPDGRPDSLRIVGSQEDVDLLVGWDDGSKMHALVCEAKAFSGWTNKQMSHKVARLRSIFEDFEDALIPHFLLLSPKPPVGLLSADWPDWMCVDGIPRAVDLPNPGTRYKITRCDGDGKPTQVDWTHWKMDERKWPSTPIVQSVENFGGGSG